MATTRAQRVDDLFRRTVVLPPDERSAFLDRACDDDAGLRAEVEDLLKHDELAGPDFLRPPIPHGSRSAPDVADDSADALVGAHVAQYRITAVIATGGMGTVYEAEQERPRRIVALKIMRTGVASRQAMRRFEFESQVLARLYHPHIAQVYEAGTCEVAPNAGAVPYFAMEYVPEARTITDYADEARLGTRGRLELFLQVCDAVHHGHQRGVIHRDLKPANLLVDAAGCVKVIDFGVARSTDSDLAVTTMRTDVGQLIGTLQYMSPEQCRGDARDLDVRSDVYALGVVLYELLCDRLPYDVTGTTLAEAARVICEQSPVRLSAVNRTLRGDVETIVLKAIEKDRDRRYQSVADLAADVRRYLAHEPIAARRPSMWYYLCRFARRNKALVVALIVTLLTLVGGIIGTTISMWSAQQALRTAHRERWQRLLTNTVVALDALDSNIARDNLDAIPLALRGWEWDYLYARTDQSLSNWPLASYTSAPQLVFSPDGERVVGSSATGSVHIWNTATGALLRTLRGFRGQGLCVAYSRAGGILAASDQHGAVRIWNVNDPDAPPLALKPFHDGGTALAICRDGSRLVAGSVLDGTTCVWDTADGSRLWCASEHGYTVRDVAFSPDGTRLAGTFGDGTVRIWDAETGEPVLSPLRHNTVPQAIAFDPAEAKLAVAADGGTIRWWDLATGNMVWKETWGRGDIAVLCFDSRRRRLAAAHGSGLVQIRDLSTNERPVMLASPAISVACMHFAPDGRSLTAVSGDGEVFTFGTLDHRRFDVLRGHGASVRSVVFTPDGARVVSGADDGTVRLWDAVTGETLAILRGHQAPVIAVAVSPDGALLASASDDRTARIWNARTGAIVQALEGHDDAVTAVAFSPDGSTLATASVDTTVRLWSLADMGTRRVLRGHTDRVKTVAFSPDGDRLASAGCDHAVRVWDVASGRQVAALLAVHRNSVENVAYSRDGAYLASGAGDGSVCVWKTTTCRRVRSFQQPAVSSIAFSPDGSRLATGASDAAVRIWATETAEQLLVLRGHTLSVNTVAFSPDSLCIASGSQDSTVRLWHTASFADRYRHREAIVDAAPRADRIVDTLFQRLGNWCDVADRIHADASLPAAVRHAALNAVLRRAAGSGPT